MLGKRKYENQGVAVGRWLVRQVGKYVKLRKREWRIQERGGMKTSHDLENSSVVCKMMDWRKEKTERTKNILETNMKENKRNN